MAEFGRREVLLWLLSHPDRVASVCPFVSASQVGAAVRDALVALSYTCGATGPAGQCVLLARHGEPQHEDSLGGRWAVDRGLRSGQAL